MRQATDRHRYVRFLPRKAVADRRRVVNGRIEVDGRAVHVRRAEGERVADLACLDASVAVEVGVEVEDVVGVAPHVARAQLCEVHEVARLRARRVRAPAHAERTGTGRMGDECVRGRVLHARHAVLHERHVGVRAGRVGGKRPAVETAVLHEPGVAAARLMGGAERHRHGAGLCACRGDGKSPCLVSGIGERGEVVGAVQRDDRTPRLDFDAGVVPVALVVLERPRPGRVVVDVGNDSAGIFVVHAECALLKRLHILQLKLRRNLERGVGHDARVDGLRTGRDEVGDGIGPAGGEEEEARHDALPRGPRQRRRHRRRVGRHGADALVVRPGREGGPLVGVAPRAPELARGRGRVDGEGRRAPHVGRPGERGERHRRLKRRAHRDQRQQREGCACRGLRHKRYFLHTHILSQILMRPYHTTIRPFLEAESHFWGWTSRANVKSAAGR